MRRPGLPLLCSQSGGAASQEGVVQKLGKREGGSHPGGDQNRGGHRADHSQLEQRLAHVAVEGRQAGDRGRGHEGDHHHQRPAPAGTPELGHVAGPEGSAQGADHGEEKPLVEDVARHVVQPPGPGQ